MWAVSRAGVGPPRVAAHSSRMAAFLAVASQACLFLVTTLPLTFILEDSGRDRCVERCHVIFHRLPVCGAAFPTRDIGGEDRETGEFAGAAQPAQYGDHHQVADGELV